MFKKIVRAVCVALIVTGMVLGFSGCVDIDEALPHYEQVSTKQKLGCSLKLSRYKMEYEKIEEYIAKILWGKRIITLDNDVFVFRSLTIEEKNRAIFVYEKALQDYKSELLSSDELIKEAHKQGAWTDVDANYYYKFDELVQVAHDQLENATVAQKNRIKRQIKKAEDRRCDVVTRYNHITSNSIEQLANEDRLKYVVQCITENFDGNTIWGDHKPFNKDTDHTLLIRLIAAYIDRTHDIFDTTTLRKIARSPQWRIRWNIGKKDPRSLFGVDLRDVNEIQLGIIYWSQVYDNVYSMIEGPTDDVIEDDVKLDEWLKKHQEEERTKKINRTLDKESKRKGFFDKKGKFHPHGKGAFDHKEVGCFLDGYYDENRYFIPYTAAEKKEILEELYGRNNPAIRQILGSEYNKLKEDGAPVREERLRKGRNRMLLSKITQ